jgi:dolichyl-phosphate beta-glucosyltransferase
MPGLSTDLSIIIPVWNEASKIALDLEDAESFFQQYQINGEILVVDDGSLDATVEIVRETARTIRYPVRIIPLGSHKGKGSAVRNGVLKSGGQLVLFIDSGSCIPYRDIYRGIQLIRDNKCDVAHASRYLPESRVIEPQNAFRRLISRIFRLLIQHYLHVPKILTDTQCGLKIYQGDLARILFNQSVIRGFLFDVEVLLLACHRGARICEFPVRWHCDCDTRLSLIRAMPQIIKEFTVIKKWQFHTSKSPNSETSVRPP